MAGTIENVSSVKGDSFTPNFCAKLEDFIRRNKGSDKLAQEFVFTQKKRARGNHKYPPLAISYAEKSQTKKLQKILKKLRISKKIIEVTLPAGRVHHALIFNSGV